VRLVDTAAAHLGRPDISTALMRKWLERGKLTHHGHDYYGRAIIDLDELDQLKPNPATCRSPVTVSH
jgi:hypothetical protein